MKEYHIKESDNEIEISFSFDNTSTILSSIFSVLVLGILFFRTKYSRILDIWGGITILIALLLYLTFNKYFEWRANRYHKLSISNDMLIINNINFKLIEIKCINIVYNNNQFELGWTIYLQNFLKTKKYIIKKRLKEEDAKIIAEKIGSFLGIKVQIDN